MPSIPARSYASQRVNKGESIRIINTEGAQVVDTWAFTLDQTEFPAYMSMVHTRSFPLHLMRTAQETFFDNRRNPILTIMEDTSAGKHDVFFAACSPERYVQLNASRDHDSCATNLFHAVEQRSEPAFRKVTEFLRYGWMPDPLNLFMNVLVEGKKLRVEEPISRPGGYVVLRAEQDCVVFMSACPMDVAICNGGVPTSADFEVIPR